jgi:hypothetical protein
MPLHGFRWDTREDHLHQYGQEVRRAAADVIGKGVLDIQARTITNTPVRHGHLKGGWQPVMPTTDTPEVVGGVGTNVDYAAYVELGTGRAGAGGQYPFPRVARYTMGWPGMAPRAMLGNAAQAILPVVHSALSRLGGRMRQL